MVSTHLKNISQIGSFPQGLRVKINNLWNHHPAKQKRISFKRKLIFQPHCFRCYVSSREGIVWETYHFQGLPSDQNIHQALELPQQLPNHHITTPEPGGRFVESCQSTPVAVTTRIISFLVGNPYKPSKRDCYWVGGRPKLYKSIYLSTWNPKKPPVFQSLDLIFGVFSRVKTKN